MTGLDPFRRRLDELDSQILQTLAERFDVCREVAEYKRCNAIPMMQSDRVAQVRERYRTTGEAFGIPAAFSADLFELLIAATCEMEDELIASPSPSPKPVP